MKQAEPIKDCYKTTLKQQRLMSVKSWLEKKCRVKSKNMGELTNAKEEVSNSSAFNVLVGGLKFIL